ncbi:MAG: DUF308 domain-containing protein [Clostridiales bacterium]|nr:DUF308 domain-containing protein [Clostridiales bacterium]
MLDFGPDFDYAKEIADKWNKKLKSLRLTSLVISVLMILLGILCIAFPQQSLILLERLASVLIIVLGAYQIVDYFHPVVFVRRTGVLINGILNILMGLLLLFSPVAVTIMTFSFLFGVLMLVFGVGEIARAHQISCFTASGYGWVIVNGIFDILAATAFLIAPLLSAIFMNLILATYLTVGGLTLLIEAISMKNMNS